MCTAVGGLPLAALEPTLDIDKATLAEELAGEVGELTPEDHVVELSVALAVRGDPDGRDVLAGCGLPQLRGATRRPIRVTWSTESPWLWTEAVCFFVVVVLLRIAAPPVMWIDATVQSGPTAERNRSRRNGVSLLGLAADRQRPATGDARVLYGVRRRST
nr:hypothetical protein [Ferrimicrobium sp.]